MLLYLCSYPPDNFFTSGSAHHSFQVSQPSFYDGGYKTNKVNKTFLKEKKLNKIERVKIVIISNFQDENFLQSFISKIWIRQYLDTNNYNPFFEKFNVLKKFTKSKKL